LDRITGSIGLFSKIGIREVTGNKNHPVNPENLQPNKNDVA